MITSPIPFRHPQRSIPMRSRRISADDSNATDLTRTRVSFRKFFLRNHRSSPEGRRWRAARRMRVSRIAALSEPSPCQGEDAAHLLRGRSGSLFSASEARAIMEVLSVRDSAYIPGGQPMPPERPRRCLRFTCRKSQPEGARVFARSARALARRSASVVSRRLKGDS